MASTFNLKIITPERIVLDTSVSQVTATARDGQLSILPDHEPLVTALGIDAFKYIENGEERFVSVIGGILEVANVKKGASGSEPKEKPPGNIAVTILSDAAELGAEIDEARANQAKARAEAEKTQRKDKLDTQLAEMALAKAMARLRAVEMARRNRRQTH